MRVHFTIDDHDWELACRYAWATHRTSSELIAEALAQIQVRYPKTPRCDRTCEERVIARILAKLPPQVQAGTLGGNPARLKG